jgi:hypothetical protein
MRARRVASTAAPATVETLERRTLLAATYYVSTKGDDANPGTDPALPWRHIQKACDAATPGSTVNVLAGRYNEKLVMNVSGNETEGHITFQANGKAVISARGLRTGGQDVIFINNRDYLKIVGFDIRDNRKVNNGSGIRLTESSSHVEIRNNRIYNITGVSAMGITVYGTEATRGIGDVVIDGNEVFRCQPAPSEAIVLNGNVHNFTVTNNYVHHVNNIGMDFIGGEGRCLDPAVDFARDGLVATNRVTRARFKGGGRDAAGIYVDGGRNIVVERNVSWRNDVGIEVNAIHPIAIASNVTVRDNFVSGNNRSGISIGGSDSFTGTVQDSRVLNNTVVANDRTRTGGGEIRVQNATNNLIADNIVSGRRGSVLLNSEPVAGPNALNYNLYFSPGNPAAARFSWSGAEYHGLDALRAATLQEGNSIFADPLLAQPAGPDLRLRPGSPAIDAGDPAFSPAAGEADLDGEPRLRGARVDVGADEAG